MTNPGSPSSWRDPILAHFTPEIATVARLTIVSDPDRLLTEETILDRIRARGFDLIPFGRPCSFSLRMRDALPTCVGSGEQPNLVGMLDTLHSDVAKLPFDLLEWAMRGRSLLRFSRAELFPDLSPAVLDELDSSVFDALHRALAINEPGGLGDNATKDFLLRHVFEIAPEQIRTAGDLLRVLLRRHYRGQRLPPSLDAWLIAQMDKTKRFTSWPLERLVPHREEFFAFLQERWPLFVKRQKATHSGVAETTEPLPLVSWPVGYPSTTRTSASTSTVSSSMACSNRRSPRQRSKVRGSLSACVVTRSKTREIRFAA